MIYRHYTCTVLLMRNLFIFYPILIYYSSYYSEMYAKDLKIQDKKYTLQQCKSPHFMFGMLL